jgi:hypothetical protein
VDYPGGLQDHPRRSIDVLEPVWSRFYDVKQFRPEFMGIVTIKVLFLWPKFQYYLLLILARKLEIYWF